MGIDHFRPSNLPKMLMFMNRIVTVAIVNCNTFLTTSDARNYVNMSPLHIICDLADEWWDSLDTVKYLVENAHCDIGEYYVHHHHLLYYLC